MSIGGHMLDWILAAFGTFGGFAVALFILKKIGPGLMDRLLGGAIRQVMDLDEGDPALNTARRNMVLWQMIYLELRIPDRGKGPERKARIEATLGPKAGPIVDELISQLDDELKKLTAIVPQRGAFPAAGQPEDGGCGA